MHTQRAAAENFLVQLLVGSPVWCFSLRFWGILVSVLSDMMSLRLELISR